ncbi:MAG: hypothetical protein ACTSSB_11345 [Candidatus Heimdallarchaeota archaeon]
MENITKSRIFRGFSISFLIIGIIVIISTNKVGFSVFDNGYFDSIGVPSLFGIIVSFGLFGLAITTYLIGNKYKKEVIN